MDTANGGGKVDVILGVNGYIWISKHVEPEGEGRETSITRIEESTSSKVYSSQNDEIEPETRREITRIRGIITLLVEARLRVDEDMIMKGYEATIDASLEEHESDDYLGGERGKRIAQILGEGS